MPCDEPQYRSQDHRPDAASAPQEEVQEGTTKQHQIEEKYRTEWADIVRNQGKVQGREWSREKAQEKLQPIEGATNPRLMAANHRRPTYEGLPQTYRNDRY